MKQLPYGQRGKPVTVLCTRCGQPRRLKSGYQVTRKKLCRKCAHDDLIQLIRSRSDAAASVTVKEKLVITPERWIDLYRRVSLRVNNGRRMATESRGGHKGFIWWSIPQTAQLLFTIRAPHAPHTPALKIALLRWLQAQGDVYKLHISSLMYQRFVTKDSNARLRAKPDKWGPALQAAGVLIHRSGPRAMRIDCGSFFVDGHWIHIG